MPSGKPRRSARAGEEFRTNMSELEGASAHGKGNVHFGGDSRMLELKGTLDFRQQRMHEHERNQGYQMF